MGTSGRGEGGTVWASSPPGAVGGGTEGESCGGPVAHLLGELSLKHHNEKLILLANVSCVAWSVHLFTSSPKDLWLRDLCNFAF